MTTHDPMTATPFLVSLHYYERAARLAESASCHRNNILREVEEVMVELCIWFQGAFPGQKLNINFRRTDELVKLNDQKVIVRDGARFGAASLEDGTLRPDLTPVVEALFTVCLLTDWYRDGRPNDVYVDPEAGMASHERSGR